jgi:hypothetical protein
MLQQAHEALWVSEGENVSFFGIPYPTRSVIARLENRDLWVWSPIKLTGDLRTEVDRLGRVRHLVSLRAARMAIIVYQPRTGAQGARQGAQLELPTRHCGSRRVAAQEQECLSCKVISLARRLIRRRCSMRSSTKR